MRSNIWLVVVITFSILLFGSSALGQTLDKNILLNEIDTLSAQVKQADESLTNEKTK